jgi:hypothetical protein
MTNNPDDTDQVSKRLILGDSTGVVLLVAFFLSAALDVINLVGTAINPQGLGRFACSISRLAIVGPPDFSRSPLRFVADQCLGPAGEPPISIIFLSIKITVAILAFIILWGCVLLRPDGLRAMNDNYYRRFQVSGGYRKEIEAFGKKSLVRVFFLLCLLLLVSISASDSASEQTLRALVWFKFLFEDGLAVAIPAIALDLSATSVVFISIALAQWNSTPKNGT